MSVSVLEIDGFLLASIQESLEDSVALQLRRDLLEGLRRTKAPGVLIDVSGVDVVDSFTARLLSEIGRAARLMGAVTVLVGLRPEVAMTMVGLDLELRDVLTELDVERGLERLRQRARADRKREW